jgi:hypothetical protein
VVDAAIQARLLKHQQFIDADRGSLPFRTEAASFESAVDLALQHVMRYSADPIAATKQRLAELSSKLSSLLPDIVTLQRQLVQMSIDDPSNEAGIENVKAILAGLKAPERYYQNEVKVHTEVLRRLEQESTMRTAVRRVAIPGPADPDEPDEAEMEAAISRVANRRRQRRARRHPPRPVMEDPETEEEMDRLAAQERVYQRRRDIWLRMRPTVLHHPTPPESQRD